MTTNQIKTVLVADDSRVARMMARTFILDIHPQWNIIEASNGLEAIAQVRIKAPDYITMDYNMPDMNGINVAEQILQLDSKIVIAMFTANVQALTRDQAESLGIGFVAKPITEASIGQALAFFASKS